jgi:hypothetical protein
MKKNASKDSLGLLTMLRREEKEGGLIPKPLEALLDCFETQNGQHFPLFWRNLQKTTSKCLLEMLQNTQKLINFS